MYKIKSIILMVLCLSIYIYPALYTKPEDFKSTKKENLPAYSEKNRNFINSLINEYLKIINYKTDYLPKLYIGYSYDKTYNTPTSLYLNGVTLGTNYYYETFLMFKFQINYYFKNYTPKLYNSNNAVESIKSKLSIFQPMLAIGYPYRKNKFYFGTGIILGYNQISETVFIDTILDNKENFSIREFEPVYAFCPGIFLEMHTHLFHHFGLLLQTQYYFFRIDKHVENLNINNFHINLSFTYDY